MTATACTSAAAIRRGPRRYIGPGLEAGLRPHLRRRARHLIEQLKQDEPSPPPTPPLTVPNQLGVDYNAHAIEQSSST